MGGFQGYIYIGDYTNASMDTVPPIVADVSITDIDENGFTVTGKVSDEGTGIDHVMFSVWTKSDGMDDLAWYTGTVSGNITSCLQLF